MQFRRAATLVVSFENRQLAVLNFLTKDRFTCSSQCLDFLAGLDDWHTAEQLVDSFPGIERGSLVEQLSQLVEFNALVVAGTPLAELDEIYRQKWEWGTVAGFYHFSVRDTQFVDGAVTREVLRQRRQQRSSPSLHQSNTDAPRVVPLPVTDLQHEPFATMRSRRSIRKFSSQPLSLGKLADCLFCGNGIVDFSDDEDFGRLPLGMTPSGGARNPFELYVYANNVDELETGFYHYAALENDLGLVRPGKVNVPEFLGGQQWTAEAAAVIFLVAHFPRSMWKYHLATAYRVVLMEAGFIGQNIALAATRHGLSAVPSGALRESLLEKYLGTPPVEASVLLTLSIGYVRDV